MGDPVAPATDLVGSLQERAERVGQTRFLGCPIAEFEPGGRIMFEVLLREGLAPSSRLLDVGCGALRLGYWVMRFLDPGCYFGIEPNVEMRELGLQLIEPDVISRAQPSFSENTSFDFSVFGERFDFALARSVWTHASRQQITAMLASFAASSTPNAVFMTSYRPASAVWARMVRLQPRLAREVASRLPLNVLSPIVARLPTRAEYEGESWVGRSHESDTPGVIEHGLPWIAEEASLYGLSVQLMPYHISHRQIWLRVRHSG
jgi:hypothetical protein